MTALRRTCCLLLALGLVLSTFGFAKAANPDSVSDQLSDSRKQVTSKHTFTLNMSASTTFDSSDTITINFASAFTVPAFTASDVSLNDGTARTILGSCSAGANNVGLSVVGQLITFTACSGFTSSSSGTVVSIVLGTGATLATNPTNAGLYLMTVAGSYGDDSRSFNLPITQGVTVSANVTGPTGDVRFTGDAFPGALVTILDGGAVVGNTVANSTSFFDKTIITLSPGMHTFGLYGQANDGRKTLTLSFNVNVLSGMLITVSGILLPPIVTVPTQEKRPVFFPQEGLARHNSTVTTFVNGPTTDSNNGLTNTSGIWGFSADDIYHLGNHTITGLVNDGGGNQSVVTNPINFEVLLSADLNIDNLIQLTDFSILMFNYATSNPPNKAADINDNGPVDLVDFSVMMFFWTGG